MRRAEKLPASPRNGPQRSVVDCTTRRRVSPLCGDGGPESFPANPVFGRIMNAPTIEEISVRAYQLWEEQGCPWGDGADQDRWLRAEAELQPDAGAPRAPERSAPEDRSLPPELRAQPPRSPDGSVPITNLDRQLPPRERTKVRAERHGTPKKHQAAPPPEQLFVVLDRAHLRIYHETPGRGAARRSWEVLQSYDLPAGREPFTRNEADQAGRFPGSHGGSPGGSIDERLPIQEEQQRRIIAELADTIEVFLRRHPEVRWDLAAEAELQHAILALLTPGVRGRARHLLPKNLVNVPLEQLREHFEAAQNASA